METLADMMVTGRTVDGPTAQLVELHPEDGPLVTAIRLDEPFRDMPVLSRSIELARSFMEFPMVSGLVDLSAYLPKEGILLYPTGHARSVAEILSTSRKTKKAAGIRAAVELCYLGGMILGEAAETGADQGVFSHGDLTPWRVLVRADGELQIIGYGLISPELLKFRQDDTYPTQADTWRYAPPERAMGAPEDAQADLCSLALIATEMILGVPLLDGSVADIRKSLESGVLPQLVNNQAKKMGKAVAEVLAYALNFDPRNRFDSAEDFVLACEGLLETGLSGDSLAECAQKVHTSKRGTALKSVDDTQAIPVAGRAIRPRGQKAVQEAIERAAENDERWESRGGRGRKASAKTPDAPKPIEAVDAEAKPKRPRRRTEEPAAEPARPRRRGDAEATDEDAKPKRPRRRPSSEDEAEAPKRPRRRPTANGETEEDEPAEAPKRPRRRPSSEDSEEEAVGKEDDAKEAPTERPKRRGSSEPTTKRPRRRKRSSEDE
ncbi:MAG: hypothetical protein ACJAZO_002084 [Myxococcota bacterium]|jgi:hypothetical protein